MQKLVAIATSSSKLEREHVLAHARCLCHREHYSSVRRQWPNPAPLGIESSRKSAFQPFQSIASSVPTPLNVEAHSLRGRKDRFANINYVHSAVFASSLGINDNCGVLLEAIVLPLNFLHYMVGFPVSYTHLRAHETVL